MAIFERESKRKPGTQSNNKLVISNGFSPAEHFITDPDLPVLFNYEYGGPGQNEVVIAKGHLVGAKPAAAIDYESGKSKTVLTLASDATPVVGMAPYNFTKHHDDFLDGNQPAIITREYVELPYFGGNVADVKDMKWGAAYGDLKIGDLVTYSREAENAGKVIKWVSGTHSVNSIAGQVLGLEADQEPQGWLKWALWDEAAKQQDLGADKTGYQAPDQGGFPYDANYAEGTVDIDGYLSQFTTNPTGVPGLHDGDQRSLTQQLEQKVVGAGQTSVSLNHKNIVDGTVTVKEGATTFVEVNTIAGVDGPGKYYVDYKNGQILTNSAAGGTLDITYRAHFFGTPSGLNFKGVQGAVRILLRF